MFDPATSGPLSGPHCCACYLVSSVILILDWSSSQINVIATNTIIKRVYPEAFCKIRYDGGSRGNI